MKLIEGLKKLRNIEKKIKKNCEYITEYSSKLSNEKPEFDSDNEQKIEIEQLLQSNKDLSELYLNLKKKIDKTNIMTECTINDETRSLHEFLTIQRKIGNLLIKTYNSLNEHKAQSKLTIYRGVDKISIDRLYSEKMKNEKIRYYSDLIDEINSSLEVINATTDIIE
ncbi:MAG: hypothetical protein ACOC33_01840 [bacterium]